MDFVIAKMEDVQNENGFFITFNRSGNGYYIVAADNDGHEIREFDDKKKAENVYLMLATAMLNGEYSNKDRKELLKCVA